MGATVELTVYVQLLWSFHAPCRDILFPVWATLLPAPIAMEAALLIMKFL